jgi:diguanylate cyclase (GGDEF)-like protein
VQRLRLQDQQQQWRWVELHTSPYCDDAGEQRGSMGSFRVVDREVAEESELRLQAGSDSLTGLLNRRSVLLFLEGHEQGGERETDLIGLLFCDIDHFKQINDTHGHAGGDQVLQTLAERLQQHTREGDLVGRLGGDELVVILRNIHNLEAVLHIAQELHRKVCQPIALAECSIQPTLSIGATVSSPGESVHNLLARADTAMYAAKQEGRNRVVSLMAEA